jgi:mxaA protein
MKALAAVAFASAAACAAADEVPTLETHEPRAYGYQVGDTLRRDVIVTLPRGWTLDESSLPRPGGRGAAIELRRVTREDERIAGGRRTRLTLEYQVLFAPLEARTLEIAPSSVRADGATRSASLRIDAVPVTVAPLVPRAVSVREGLGEWQPDHAPPPFETRAVRWRLLLWAVLALGLLGWLAVVHVGNPWRAARRRPFARAWRELRRLPRQAAGAERRAACRRLHAALNQAAGEALFEGGVARFVERQPKFGPLQSDLARFLAASRNEFFGQQPGAGEVDTAWLVGFSRRLRDAERGGA